MRPSYCNGVQISANPGGPEYVLSFYHEYPDVDADGKDTLARESVSSLVVNQACAIALRDALSETIDRVIKSAESQDEQPG